jgi:hypothetical protein
LVPVLGLGLGLGGWVVLSTRWLPRLGAGAGAGAKAKQHPAAAAAAGRRDLRSR